MKQLLLTLLLTLPLTPIMAQIGTARSDLKPLDVSVPQKGSPKPGGSGRLSLYFPEHSFAHDGKLVYYNGIPLRDSDYRKKLKVVEYYYEQFSLPSDIMMSAMPPQRIRQILYLSNNGNLYYQSQKLEGASPDSFEPIPLADALNIGVDSSSTPPFHYLKSNNRIYYLGTELEGINTDKFHYLKMKSPTAPSILLSATSYASDSVNTYCLGKRIANADVESFQILSTFSKDKRRLYCKHEAVEGVDGGTFKEVDHLHFKDTSSVYMLVSLASCEQPTLKPDGGLECDGELYYFLSKAYRDSLLSKPTDNPPSPQIIYNRIYPYLPQYNALKRIPADPATFQVLNLQRTHYYSKDARNVFINGKPIEGANPEHFRYISSSYSDYAADDKHVFYFGKLIEGANPEYFHCISNKTSYSDYAADDKHVFYLGELLEGADPYTFVPMLGYDTYYDYYKDKNRIYYRGKAVEGLTPATFDISGFYLKLDGKVWLRIPHSNLLTKELKGVDLATFTTYDRPFMYSTHYDIVPCPYAKDSKTVYYRGTPMSDVDVESFQPYQNSGYAYDKQKLYFNGERVERPEPFNPKGFSVIAYMNTNCSTENYQRNVYARCSEFYYFNERILPLCSPDKELTFYDGSRNESCTIFAFCDGYIYCRGKLAGKGTVDDVRTHHYGSYLSPFWNNRDTIYYEDKPIAKASERLWAMDSEYAVIGGNRVYYKDKEVEVADVKTFRTLSDGHYAKDNSTAYFEGKKLEQADAASFDRLGLGYARDKYNVYYKGEVVKGADARSMSLNYSTYNYDDKYAYYLGERYKLPKR